MVSDLTNITMPMAALLASMIGATATITAAFLQLRIAWRRELLARAEHKPVTKKAKRGPITPVIVLLVASAIGGFALSQYLVSEGRKKDEVQELELRNRIDQLTVSAQRLEHVSLYGVDDLLSNARIETVQKMGNDGVVALVATGKCVSATGDGAACSEQQAMNIQLCTEVPVSVTVTNIDFFARADDEFRPWSDSQVLAGVDFGGGRFGGKPNEQLVNDSFKQVCQGLDYWNSEAGLQARMVVHYVPNQQIAVIAKQPAIEVNTDSVKE